MLNYLSSDSSVHGYLNTKQPKQRFIKIACLKLINNGNGRIFIECSCFGIKDIIFEIKKINMQLKSSESSLIFANGTEWW